MAQLSPWLDRTAICLLYMNPELLIIVRYSAVLIIDDLCLSYFLMDIETKAILISERLPLSQGAVLSWVGFSDYGVSTRSINFRLL